MLNEESKQELIKNMDEAKEINKFIMNMRKGDTFPATEWHILLTYLNIVKLVRHSAILTLWTKVIAATSVALIVFAIAQIIFLIFINK